MALWVLWGEARLVCVQGLGESSGQETLIWVSSLGLILICQNYSIIAFGGIPRMLGEPAQHGSEPPRRGLLPVCLPLITWTP